MLWLIFVKIIIILANFYLLLLLQKETPLHYACLNGHTGVATLLIDKGANIHAKTGVSNIKLIINRN